jgi:alanyl-tRNA synthetase
MMDVVMKKELKVDGATLVNNDDPQVIEMWNNVFMEFDAKSRWFIGEIACKQHVDTGMGFERLVRVLQKKQSNYDTDVFKPVIDKIEELAGLRYKPEEEEKHPKQLIINIACVLLPITFVQFHLVLLMVSCLQIQVLAM